MSSVVLLSDDTIDINGTVLTALSNGTYSELTFGDELTTTEIGKNGNALITRKSAGQRGELSIRIMTGSADDKYLNNLLVSQMSKAPSFVPLTGYAAKIMNVDGKPVTLTYTFSGGSFMKQVESMSTTEGSADQIVSVYRLRFAVVTRGFS
jgi:hypothetical protein